MSVLNGERDPAFEREFLHQAERLAGMTNSGWSNEVLDRLLEMEREKGRNSYIELGLKRCIRETSEEGLDIGGWPTVASLLAYREIQDVDQRHDLHLLLTQIASYGPLIRELCRQALDILDG